MVDPETENEQLSLGIPAADTERKDLTKDERVAGMQAALKAGLTSAKIVHAPDPEKGERAVATQGVGGTQAAQISGEIPAHPTPIVNPDDEAWGQRKKDRASGMHSATNPSHPSNRHQMAGDNADAEREQEEFRKRQAEREPKPPEPVTPEEEDQLDVWG